MILLLTAPPRPQQVCISAGGSSNCTGRGKAGLGLERCQCRKARIQRNHIACAFLVWVRLKEVATQTGQTIYQLKHGLLDDYLRQQLKNPSIKMSLA